MKHTLAELDAGQLELMWNFLRAGFVKSNIPALKEHLDRLRRMMIQKTGGQKDGISFEDLGTVVNCIVIEAMALYLSGDLDKIGKENNEETKNDT